VYDNNTKPYDIQRLGLGLKRKLRTKNVSLRLIPNATSALSSAVSYHNKLGSLSTKVELMIVRSEDSGSLVLAETKSTQNITAYSKRDQARPKRDAFVGMLPPKLAQTIINLALGDKDPSELTLLDPFVVLGVILQEAGLNGL
jgi:tRNA G10  N-methylase Trm11